MTPAGVLGPFFTGMRCNALLIGTLLFALSSLANSLQGGQLPQTGNKRFRFDAALGAEGNKPTGRKRGASAECMGSDKAAEQDQQAVPKLPTKEALFQLTTQLFSPQNSGTRKQNLFKVLGIDKAASTKEVRDAYYREARKWHPDKNKHDPQAEARFKLISEAYEVLSNPAKRKAYEEGGREGLDAAEAADNIDVKSVVRALFGGGEFDDIMGDVGEIPILRRMVERSDDMMRDDQADEGKELTEEEKRRKELSDKEKEEKEQKQEEEFAEEEKMQCAGIGDKLLSRLSGRAMGSIDAGKFEKECKEWAEQLCKAPGGLDLVKMTSKSWRQKGKMYAKRLWGLESLWTRVRDFAGKISEGAGLLMGAMKATRMTRDALVKGALAKNVTKGEEGEGEETKKHKGEAAGTGAGALEDEEGDEKEDNEMNIDKEEMLKIAKVSLDVIWRFGIFLLQGRVRNGVDAMFDKFRNSTDYSATAEGSLALSLIEMSSHFRSVYDTALAANSTVYRTGVPIHLDEMTDAA